MDAIKVLGGLLSQRAGRSGGAGAILGQVLNGVAAATNPSSQPVSSPLESVIRDSIVRHHQAGGQVHPSAATWVQQRQFAPNAYPPGNPQTGYPPVGYAQSGYPQPGYPQPNVHVNQSTRHAPVPRQDVPSDPQYTNLSYDQRGEILIQAMIMAAQADGKVDANEQSRILAQLQPLTQSEIDFLNRAFSTRHDIEAFVHTIPRGMEHEVYQISMMAINVDDQREVAYLRNLANALRISPAQCNQMHQNMGWGGVF